MATVVTGPAAVGGPLARLQTGIASASMWNGGVGNRRRPDDPPLGTQPKTTPLMGIMAKYANTASSASEGASTLMAHEVRPWLRTRTPQNPLENASIAVIGYGSQGRAQALNLHSGLNVRLGLRPGGYSWRQAETDGWQPLPVTEAVQEADVVVLLVPYPAQPKLFAEQVASFLQPGALLLFSHGFNVHFRQLDLPPGVDVGWSLQKRQRPGSSAIRRGAGSSPLVAVEQDTTGTAKERTVAYAEGLGAGRAAILDTTGEETETDLRRAGRSLRLTKLSPAGWRSSWRRATTRKRLSF